MIARRFESGKALIAAGIFLLPALFLKSAPVPESYQIKDHGQVRTFVIATNELQVKGKRSLETISPASLNALRQQADELARIRGKDVQLVLYPVGHSHDQFSRRILTRDVLVHAASDTDIQQLASQNGATISRTFSDLPGHYLLTTTDSFSALSLAQQLRGESGILSAEPQLARLMQKKLVPNDTFFTNQWHLLNIGQSGGSNGIDLNVTNVWEHLRGSNVFVAIVDDGLQYLHPDLAPNCNTNIDYDFNDNDDDPAPDPRNWDFHGTAVGGLVGAAGNNGIGVCGAAYEATLVGLRLIAYPETDAQDAAAMSHSNSIIHIKNNSWGPADCPFDGSTLEAPGPLMQAAVADGVANGRGGKGVIYTWACGNGQSCGESVNYDGYANSINVFAIGAVNDQGDQASYSEPGACLAACTPSGEGNGVTTTDLIGEDGYNSYGMGDLSDNNYTENFSGTSASAPLAAGVIALMLQANPNLGYRDVKEILLRSSTVMQPDDPDWATNSAGIRHNHKFGAGLINAQAAVCLATNWACLGPATNVSMMETNLGISIPDNDTNGVTRSYSFSNLDFRVEHVTLTMTAPHQNWGNLAVTLTSPSGLQSRLAESHGPVDTSYGYQAWVFSSVRHWGENANGTWTVTVADEVPGDTGTLQALELKLYGTMPQALLSANKTNYGLQVRVSAAAPGWNYVLEASTNFLAWTSLTTQAIPANGHFDFTDTNTPSCSQRFYRARLLP